MMNQLLKQSMNIYSYEVNDKMRDGLYFIIIDLKNDQFINILGILSSKTLRYEECKNSSKTSTSSWLDVGRCLDTLRYGVMGAQPGTSITVSMVLTLVGTWVFCCFTST